MFKDSTNLNVESTASEQCVQSELEPLIRCHENVPTNKETCVARAQFLALCWALFVIGWTDGSTGPLLPRIQKFYDVGWPIPLTVFFFQPSITFCRLDSKRCLGYLFCNVQSVIILLDRDTNRCHLTPFSGNSCGSIAQYAFERQTRFGKGD
jgi:hypothetical protein